MEGVEEQFQNKAMGRGAAMIRGCKMTKSLHDFPHDSFRMHAKEPSFKIMVAKGILQNIGWGG